MRGRRGRRRCVETSKRSLSTGRRSPVTAMTQQARPRTEQGDCWRSLFGPFQQVTVSGHDVVRALGSGERNEVVVVAITSRDRHINRIRSEIDRGADRVDIQSGRVLSDEATKARPIKYLTDLFEQARADHHLKRRPPKPELNDPVRCPEVNRRRHPDIRVNDDPQHSVC